MNIIVLTGNKVVFAVYGKTICFKKSFDNDEQKKSVRLEADACAFRYAATYHKTYCHIFEDETIETDEDMFNFLGKAALPVS